MDAQSKGKAQESVHYQNILHKNLTYLASLADPNQNLATVIPPPQTIEQATSYLNVNKCFPFLQVILLMLILLTQGFKCSTWGNETRRNDAVTSAATDAPAVFEYYAA